MTGPGVGIIVKPFWDGNTCAFPGRIERGAERILPSEALVELIIEGNERLIAVRIVGPLDGSTCRMLRDSLLELSDSGRNRIRVDLTDMPLIDTSGVGVLVGARTTVRMRGGDLTLVSPQPDVLRTLQRLGLDADLLEPPHPPGGSTGQSGTP